MLKSLPGGHIFSFFPSSTCSAIHSASLVKVFFFNSLIKEQPVIYSSVQQIFIQYFYVPKKERRKKEVLLLLKPEARCLGVLLLF